MLFPNFFYPKKTSPMRKLYILLILVLGPLVTVLAQPTILVGNNGTACNDGVNDAFCVPVTTLLF